MLGSMLWIVCGCMCDCFINKGQYLFFPKFSPSFENLGFSVTGYGKPEGTFWPGQYVEQGILLKVESEHVTPVIKIFQIPFLYTWMKILLPRNEWSDLLWAPFSVVVRPCLSYSKSQVFSLPLLYPSCSFPTLFSSKVWICLGLEPPLRAATVLLTTPPAPGS